MNKVFPHQLRKAHGMLHFAALDQAVLAAAAGVSLLAAVAVHLFVGLVLFGLVLAAIVVHRRLDHQRLDHLELFFRMHLARPEWSLCERDERFVRFPHGP